MAGKISSETRKKVIDLYSEGRSKKAISEETGISVTSVSRIILDSAKPINSASQTDAKSSPSTEKNAKPDNLEKEGKNGRYQQHNNSVEIPIDRLDSLVNTIIEALRENVQQSLDITISRFTPDNVKKFLTMLTDEDKARSDIESLKGEIERLNRVKEGLDSEILDAVMRMSSIESRIINIEKRFGIRLQEESEEP
jgi:chemotaxis protein histidine kinase CheA